LLAAPLVRSASCRCRAKIEADRAAPRVRCRLRPQRMPGRVRGGCFPDRHTSRALKRNSRRKLMFALPTRQDRSMPVRDLRTIFVRDLRSIRATATLRHHDDRRPPMADPIAAPPSSTAPPPRWRRVRGSPRADAGLPRLPMPVRHRSSVCSRSRIGRGSMRQDQSMAEIESRSSPLDRAPRGSQSASSLLPKWMPGRVPGGCFPERHTIGALTRNSKRSLVLALSAPPATIDACPRSSLHHDRLHRCMVAFESRVRVPRSSPPNATPSAH
jgi:hypothetical protein